jgi:hypothetical protein
MSDFKKGDRVKVTTDAEGRKYQARVGTVERAAFGLPGYMVTVDGYSHALWFSPDELRLVAPAPTPPLSFSDVRTGDKITVEGEGLTISGVATRRGPKEIGLGPLTTLMPGVVGDWQTCDSNIHVTLTAHEPDRSWHRAKVIKARYLDESHPSERLDYWVRDENGEFRNGNVTCAVSAEDYELTDITVIVDEHGAVVS